MCVEMFSNLNLEYTFFIHFFLTIHQPVPHLVYILVGVKLNVLVVTQHLCNVDTVCSTLE